MLTTVWTNERRRALIRTVHKQVQERAALKQDLQAIGRALAKEPVAATNEVKPMKQRRKQTKKLRDLFTAEVVAQWHRWKAEGKSYAWIAENNGLARVADVTVRSYMTQFPADPVTETAPARAEPVTNEPKNASGGGALVLAGDADESPAAWVNGLTRRINAFRDEMEAIGVPVDVKVSLHLVKEIRLE